MFCLYLFVWLYPLSWVIVLSRLALPLQKRWNYCQVEENEALRRQNVLKMFWYQELRTVLLLSTSPTSPPTHTQIPPYHSRLLSRSPDPIFLGNLWSTKSKWNQLIFVWSTFPIHTEHTEIFFSEREINCDLLWPSEPWWSVCNFSFPLF